MVCMGNMVAPYVDMMPHLEALPRCSLGLVQLHRQVNAGARYEERVQRLVDRRLAVETRQLHEQSDVVMDRFDIVRKHGFRKHRHICRTYVVTRYDMQTRLVPTQGCVAYAQRLRGVTKLISHMENDCVNSGQVQTGP